MYCLFGGLQIAQQPGLQYDEAYLVAGAVHMNHSAAEFPLPHSNFTWMCAARHCLPLMAEIPYIGAIKEYLAAPVFALTGPNVNAIRTISLLLGCIGIWGLMRLTDTLAGPLAAGAFGMALAINPAYIDTTVFDNNAVGGMMAGLGLVSAALARYLKSISVEPPREALWAAFYVGVATGFAIWTRANIVWTLAAGALAAVAVFRLSLLRPLKHWLLAAAGGIVGGLPFLVYQWTSRGGTWNAAGLFIDDSPWRDRLYVRLVLLAETLTADREHRAMWGDAAMPDLERWLPLGTVLVSCLVCLSIRRPDGVCRFAQFCSLSFLLSILILLTSRMQISEHHLIAALPFAILVVVLACSILYRRYPRIWPVTAGLGFGYIALCLQWHILAVGGLHNTGGIGMWSSAASNLTRRLERDDSKQMVKVVDWGFQDNIYVLSDGRVRSQEIFWGATDQRAGSGRPWTDEIRLGGTFVVAGPENRNEPTAGASFLKALAASNATIRRETVLQRSGLTYAEIIDVEPNTARPSSTLSKETVVAQIAMGDANIESRIGGFYKPEDAGWRWTKRDFFVVLQSPKVVGGRPWLQVNLYLPENRIQQQGPITLSARIGSHQLAPERYETGGAYTFSRQLDEQWLGDDSYRIDFSLDKVQAPGSADPRELGIVVRDAAIRVR